MRLSFTIVAQKNDLRFRATILRFSLGSLAEHFPEFAFLLYMRGAISCRMVNLNGQFQQTYVISLRSRYLPVLTGSIPKITSGSYGISYKLASAIDVNFRVSVSGAFNGALLKLSDEVGILILSVLPRHSAWYLCAMFLFRLSVSTSWW